RGDVMAATARAVTVDEVEPDRRSGSSLTSRDQAMFEAGLESWVRTIQKASPELKEDVIRNAASEGAGYIQKGFSRQIVVDRLNEEARSGGLTPNAEDLSDVYITSAAAIGVDTTDDPVVPMEPRGRTRLKPVPWSELHRLPKREALIEGLLDCGALSLMFGPSGCGKTFFALDLAAHVASGMSW